MPRFALRPAALAALLIAIGAIRMATTFRVFSATSDEATHIGAGLEVYQYHRYQFQRENPPLPRLVMAIAAGKVRAGGEVDSVVSDSAAVFCTRCKTTHAKSRSREETKETRSVYSFPRAFFVPS